MSAFRPAPPPRRIKLYPYQRGIADAIADPKIERVTVLKSARVGYTAVLLGSPISSRASVADLGPDADRSGLPRLLVSHIEPLFMDRPALRDSLPMPRPGPSDRNNLLHRIFDGGSLIRGTFIPLASADRVHRATISRAQTNDC